MTDDEYFRPTSDRDSGPVYRNIDIMFYVGDVQFAEACARAYDISVRDLEDVARGLNQWFGSLETGLAVLNSGDVDLRRDPRVGVYSLFVDLADERNFANLAFFFSAGKVYQELLPSLAADFATCFDYQNSEIVAEYQEDGEQKPLSIIYAQGRWYVPEVGSLLAQGREALRDIFKS